MNIKSLLTDSYENAGQFLKAYENADELFRQCCKYEYYKRVRLLSEKVLRTDEFWKNAEMFFQTDSRDYGKKGVHLSALSFDGYAAKLFELCSKDKCEYGYLKYAAYALTYRVTAERDDLPRNLQEYVGYIKHSKSEGIIDMLPKADASECQIALYAVELLKKQVQLHIDAATRSRYEKAAYYCGAAFDIYRLFGFKDLADEYVSEIMIQNKRRPAFKDEMRKRFAV
jgi:hypothetical protein